MDKNSVIGTLLIGAIIIGYMAYTAPSQEEIAKANAEKEAAEAKQAEKDQLAQESKTIEMEAAKVASEAPIVVDTNQIAVAEVQDKPFNISRTAENEYFIIENDFIKVTISSLGGRVSNVELKNYQTHDSLPLIILDEDHSKFGLLLFVDNKYVETSKLQFETNGSSFNVREGESNSIAMRHYASETEYIEFTYTLAGNSYEVNSKINLVGINNYLPGNISSLPLDWEVTALPLEKNVKDERTKYSTIYFKYKNDDADYISEGSDDTEKLIADFKWVAFKQQFFTSILTADESFLNSGDLTTLALTDSMKVLKTMTANLNIPYNNEPNQSFGMSFYFGPID